MGRIVWKRCVGGEMVKIACTDTPRIVLAGLIYILDLDIVESHKPGHHNSFISGNLEESHFPRSLPAFLPCIIELCIDISAG